MGIDQVSCVHCGEVIGVYEPMIVVVDGAARETSQAAETDLAQIAGAFYYHRVCYGKTAD